MSNEERKKEVGLYCVYDSAAEEYSAPFVAKTEAVAIRSYKMLLQREGVSRASDYSLFRVGSWFADEGVVCGYDPIRIQVPSISEEEIHRVFPGAKVLDGGGKNG